MTSKGSEDISGSAGRIQLSEDDLRITQVEVSDSGRYTCNATNNKGVQVATATLTVLCKFSSPILFCLSHHSVSFSFGLSVRDRKCQLNKERSCVKQPSFRCSENEDNGASAGLARREGVAGGDQVRRGARRGGSGHVGVVAQRRAHPARRRTQNDADGRHPADHLRQERGHRQLSVLRSFCRGKRHVRC